MATPTPPSPDRPPKQNRFFSLTLVGVKVGWSEGLVMLVLAIAALLSLATFLLPYKVHCEGGGEVANQGASSRATAEAYAREQEQKGMSCRRDYPPLR